MTSPKVLVATLSAPELSRLAIELDRRGALTQYVRPYTNKGRLWERVLERTPKLGSVYRRTLGRRVPPAGLPPAKVIEAGVLHDFAAAGIGRLPLGNEERRHRLVRRMSLAAEIAVARTAGRYARCADVVVASYGTGVEGFVAVKRRGGRAVLHYPAAHDRYQRKLMAEDAELSPEFATALPDFAAVPAEYERRLDRECAEADRILVASSFAKHAFVAEGYDPQKIVAIAFGVDTARFNPPITARRRERFRVLFVGHIGQRKGVSYLLQGYELFRRPDSELHLVGSFVPGAAQAYERFSGSFQHTPHVPQAELPEIYRAADVFVLPTLTEGMPLVVLEAMACGLPVIATPNGPSDLIEDGTDGFIVPIRDPRAIAEKLQILYQDPELRATVGRRAREKALRFGWDVYAGRAADAVTNFQ
jgi:glycosyltransferase involved in cell wall biosynthesis